MEEKILKKKGSSSIVWGAFYNGRNLLIDNHRQQVSDNRRGKHTNQTWHHKRVVEQVLTNDGCA